MLILGEKEMTDCTVSVRRQGAGDLGSMTLEVFAKLIADEIAEVMEKNQKKRIIKKKLYFCIEIKTEKLVMELP